MPHLPPDRADHAAVVLPTALQPCNEKILPMLFQSAALLPSHRAGSIFRLRFPAPQHAAGRRSFRAFLYPNIHPIATFGQKVTNRYDNSGAF